MSASRRPDPKKLEDAGIFQSDRAPDRGALQRRLRMEKDASVNERRHNKAETDIEKYEDAAKCVRAVGIGIARTSSRPAAFPSSIRQTCGDALAFTGAPSPADPKYLNRHSIVCRAGLLHGLATCCEIIAALLQFAVLSPILRSSMRYGRANWPRRCWNRAGSPGPSAAGA